MIIEVTDFNSSDNVKNVVSWKMAKSTDFISNLSSFTHWLCPRANYLTLLSLQVLTYEIELVIFMSQDHSEN